MYIAKREKTKPKIKNMLKKAMMDSIIIIII